MNKRQENYLGAGMGLWNRRKLKIILCEFGSIHLGNQNEQVSDSSLRNMFESKDRCQGSEKLNICA